MGTERAGKIVATEYRQGASYLTQMGDNTWSAYTGPNGSGRELASGFRTLRDARQWCRERQ